MKYFYYLILIVIFFRGGIANAQSNDLYNVKLKSGLVIKCELLKVVPDSFIVIRQYGQVNTIKYSEIESVDFSQAAVRASPAVPVQTVYARPVRRKKSVPDSGLSVGLQTGLCFGTTTEYSMPTVSILLRLSALYTLDKRWQAGIALGIDPYLQYDAVLTSIQGEGRFHLSKDKAQSTFLHGQAGYGFNIVSSTNRVTGGPCYTAGIGQSFRDRKENIFSIIVAYRSQNITQEMQGWDSRSGDFNRTYHRVFNRLEFKVEFRF